jgi:hypothetical protein
VPTGWNRAAHRRSDSTSVTYSSSVRRGYCRRRPFSLISSPKRASESLGYRCWGFVAGSVLQQETPGIGWMRRPTRMVRLVVPIAIAGVPTAWYGLATAKSVYGYPICRTLTRRTTARLEERKFRPSDVQDLGDVFRRVARP